MKAEATALRIGLDFGGVIVKPGRRSKADTLLPDVDAMQAAQEGVVEAVREMILWASGNVWIVSKARPSMQTRTLHWLKQVDFFTQTGLSPNHVLFCVERTEKQPICQALDITHFVDDHIHVLHMLRKTVPHLYLFGAKDHRAQCPPWLTFVSSWPHLLMNMQASFTQ